MKVLLIEDNLGIKDIVAITLELKWSDADLIHSHLGKNGVELARTELPDIIILDLGLPDITGFEVLRHVRKFSDVPVIILTARGEEKNKLEGLDLGADDYIVKPFSSNELIARMKALLRRSQMTEKTDKIIDRAHTRDKLRIDFSTEEVRIGGKLLKLSPREFELLSLLVTDEGKVLSNQVLLEKVFPEQKDDIRFLKVYMNRLSEKLGDNPDNPTIILNEGGQGYKFIGQ
jgi:two-component system KDP operon response regulator KdpE